MSLLLRQSVGQIKCEIVGHTVLPQIETILFNGKENGKLYTKCSRCDANILLKINPKKSDEYFIVEY